MPNHESESTPPQSPQLLSASSAPLASPSPLPRKSQLLTATTMATLSSVVLIFAMFVSYFYTPDAQPIAPRPPNSFTRIHQIQAASHTSPLLNQVVTVRGIVTALAKNGFYLQDVQPDDDIATSDGIFVYTAQRPTVNRADEVSVTGKVNEYVGGGRRRGANNLSVTQISPQNPDDIVVRSSSNTLPTPIVIGSDFVVKNYRCRRFPSVQYCPRDIPQSNVRVAPNQRVASDNFLTYDPNVNGIDFFESLEGMLVTVRQPVTVSTKSRVGEVWVVADAGADANLGPRGALLISEGNFNPERIQIDPDRSVFDTRLPDLPIGTKFGDITGVVTYNFGSYEVIPTGPVQVVEESKLKPMSTSLMPILSSGSALNVASMNALNLDPTDGDKKFQDLAGIIVKNLRSPDIVALQEVQDENGAEKSGTISAALTLQLLVTAIEMEPSCSLMRMCPSYEFIDNEFIGKDTSGGEPGGNIRVAYLYRTDRVRLDKGSLNSIVDATDQQTNPRNVFYRSRLPLAARFVHIQTGRTIEMINVHFSSKGGSAPLFGKLQPADQRQEDDTVNGSVDERRAQANAVRDYLEKKPNTERARVIMTGDFNEFEFVSPLKILESQLTLMTRKIEPGKRYTYIFEGNAQTLDHFLVGSDFATSAKVENIHVNCEFPNAASDHDPVLLRINV